jgi:hypothetical protein
MANVPATYQSMKDALTDALFTLEVLAGNTVSPTVSMQEVAQVAASRFHRFAEMLAEAAQGNHESFIVFPDASECLSNSRVGIPSVRRG